MTAFDLNFEHISRQSLADINCSKHAKDITVVLPNICVLAIHFRIEAISFFGVL